MSRIKNVYVTPETVIVNLPTIPVGARWQSCWFDTVRECFVIQMEHESFDEVDDPRDIPTVKAVQADGPLR